MPIRFFTAGIALAAVLAPLSSRAVAYPISPATLWQLVEEAHLIVVAHVDDVSENVARLRVLETWKGASAAVVEVEFMVFICPAPARYERGEVVLAFLERGPRGRVQAGRYSTLHMSYGTLYPRATDRAVFRARVAEALDAQSDPQRAARRKRAWLIRCGERRATRWQGLYELAAAADELHVDYDSSSRRKETWSLTEAEQETLRRGFVEEPSGDHTIAMVLALAAVPSGSAFEEAVLGQLERALQDEQVWYWLPGCLARVLEGRGARDGLRELGLSRHDYEVDARRLRAAWVRARSRFGVPTVPAAMVPPEEQWGVGSRTPE